MKPKLGNETGAEALQTVQEKDEKLRDEDEELGQMVEDPELEEKLHRRVRVMLQRGV